MAPSEGTGALFARVTPFVYVPLLAVEELSAAVVPPVSVSFQRA
jgi:hypothetical protein